MKTEKEIKDELKRIEGLLNVLPPKNRPANSVGYWIALKWVLDEGGERIK